MMSSAMENCRHCYECKPLADKDTINSFSGVKDLFESMELSFDDSDCGTRKGSNSTKGSDNGS